MSRETGNWVQIILSGRVGHRCTREFRWRERMLEQYRSNVVLRDRLQGGNVVCRNTEWDSIRGRSRRILGGHGHPSLLGDVQEILGNLSTISQEPNDMSSNLFVGDHMGLAWAHGRIRYSSVVTIYSFLI